MRHFIEKKGIVWIDATRLGNKSLIGNHREIVEPQITIQSSFLYVECILYLAINVLSIC